jgi:seryl-tRNA synthetase
VAKTKHEADKNLRPGGKLRQSFPPERIFNRKHTGLSVHYFTAGTGVDRNTARDVTKEQTPFRFPPETEEFSYKAWRQRFREQESRYDFRTRPNFRSRQNMDILNRLYIPDEEVEASREPDLLDIDPQFFKVIQGRPIREKLDIRKYVEEVRETFRTRLKVGYQTDEAMKIDKKFRQEQKRFNKIQAMLKLYSDSFEEFLEEDYESSEKLLRDAQEQAEKSGHMRQELRELEKQVETAKCQLHVLLEEWRNCKMFQKFLYMVSPMFWRKEHDFIHRTQSGSVLLASEISTHFEQYRLSSTESPLSLDALLDLCLTDVNKGEEPLLYFTEPDELMQVFKELELQNLNALLHSETLSDPTHSVQRSLEQARKNFETESASLMDKIENLKAAITWEEERAQSLRDKAKELLYGLFKDVIVSESVLNLHVFVEDAYEKCVGPSDGMLGLKDMMREIELKMQSLLLTLDCLPLSTVKMAQTETYEEEARVMKMAREAEAKLKLAQKLKRRLKKALEPPAYRSGKQLKPRSAPPFIRKEIPKQDKRLADENKDFLNFFTDYCHHVDNASDYLPLKII